ASAEAGEEEDIAQFTARGDSENVAVKVGARSRRSRSIKGAIRRLDQLGAGACTKFSTKRKLRDDGRTKLWSNFHNGAKSGCSPAPPRSIEVSIISQGQLRADAWIRVEWTWTEISGGNSAVVQVQRKYDATAATFNAGAIKPAVITFR